MSKKYLIVLRLFILVFILNLHSVYAQTVRIDSLKNQLYFTKANDIKQDITLKICEQYHSLPADSLKNYVELGLSLSDKNSSAHFKFKNYYCFYFLKSSKTKEANVYMDSLHQALMKQNNDERLVSEINYHKAICLIRNGNIKESISLGLNFLEGAEKRKDTLNILRAYTLLGLANMELENEGEAFIWLKKGIKLTNNSQLLQQANALYINLASCYKVEEKFDTALHYINKGLLFSQQVENLTSEANALNIRATIYSKKNRTKDALSDLESALVIRKKIGDLHFIIADLGLLAHYYAFVNEPQKGIKVALEGIELAKGTNNLNKLIYLKKGLANNYLAAGQKDKYGKTLIDVIQLKDSLYEKNTEIDIAEMGAKYELQKKQNIIIQQENNLIRSRYITVGSIIALLLGFIIALLIYRNYNHVKERKMEQAIAEEKINSLKAIKIAEEKERKRIAADLHDNLGSYAAAITSNIRYLKDNDGQQNQLVINQLDDNANGIVTQLSDSIWVLKNEHLSITKLADRFKSWTQRIIQNYPNVKYFYEEDIINDIELAPSKILNIFLILKECLNNALKHSDCSEVRIRVVSDGNLLIEITDNGKGFQSNLMNNGNGIENIKFRAKECDLQTKWENQIPSGTKVSIKSHTTN